MTPERYRQVGELYHAALSVKTEERVAFLDRVCEGDEDLRREVESLIESHTQAADFIAEPALADVAQVLAAGQSTELIGQRIARYRVVSLIGAGGMGRVYLAQDTVLGRRVALKLLPEHLTHDKIQVQRFRQEARAASALNHPNILTVHEIGQVDGAEFIATEYVEGETLRARLTRTSLKTVDALDIAGQVAGALIVAHAAGIIHRDIKPENVMIRPDGYVKVLDFGLAKLTENLSGPPLRELDAATAIMTNPGVVMGTVEYMSPEQARGRPVDGRTDVWSLGVVIYEMLAGLRPFEAATQGDVIVSVLEKEPLALTRHAAHAPAELERIVTKALAKDTDERYQTIKDMAIDLKRLSRRMQVEAELERTAQPKESGKPATTDGQKVVESTQRQAVTRTVGGAALTSSLEYAVIQIRRQRAVIVLAGVLFTAVLGGAGYSLYRLLSWNETKPPAPFQAMKITQVTGDGNATVAAISPDGRYVAYVLRDKGREMLRVRQVATSSDLQLVPPAEIFYVGLTFSPDGDYLYYVTLQAPGAPGVLLESKMSGTLYRVPVLGGTSRRLLTGVDDPVTFSPDGGRFAFVRAYSDRGETALMVANADGSGEQRLAGRPIPDVYVRNQRYGSGPAWSPDGKVIVCGVGRFAQQHVVAVSAVDGSEKPVGSRSWQFVGRLAWLPDGSGLVMIGKDENLPSQLWQLSYPAGEARRITNDLNIYEDVSLDADAGSLVTIQRHAGTKNLWVVAPDDDSAQAKKIMSAMTGGPAVVVEVVSWTPDGRLVYTAKTGDRTDLWVVNHDGTEQKQLTAFGKSLNGRPSVSPDGRYIVFGSDMAGPHNIWRVDIDGSNPVRLTSGELESWPTCSPDGRWVVYASDSSGENSLWKVPIEGGEPVQLTATVGFTIPSVSPDGKAVAYLDRDERVGSPVRVRIVVIPFEGGDPVKTIDLPPTFEHLAVRWTPDGRALAYVDTRDGVDNIWSRPLEGGASRQITDFKSDRIGIFDWSSDGKQLALWSGTPTSNVVLISNFR
jgi:serine/threonine protein kinase/Tol biopolymer transport system component